MDKKDLTTFVRGNGEVEVGEHYKGSSFYATKGITIDQEIVDEVIDEFPELNKFIGYHLSIDGHWDSDWGFDSYGDEVEIYRLVEKIIPEKVIPAHTETKYVKVKFEDFV